MHEWIVIWRGSGGAYHAEGFSRQPEAEARLEALRWKPTVVEVRVIRT